MYTKTNVPGIQLDEQTNAIINTDMNGYNAMIRERKITACLQRNEDDINSIKKDIIELKQILNTYPKVESNNG